MTTITQIKIQQDDGTYSDPVPIGASAENVTLTDGTTVEASISSIDSSISDLQDLQIKDLEVNDNKLIINTGK